MLPFIFPCYTNNGTTYYDVFRIQQCLLILNFTLLVTATIEDNLMDSPARTGHENSGFCIFIHMFFLFPEILFSRL